MWRELFVALLATSFLIVENKAYSDYSIEVTSGSGEDDDNTSNSDEINYSNESDEDNKSSDEGCRGDANATSGCDTQCRRRCPSDQKPTRCRCPKNSCECKEDFVYDPLIYACVLPEDCSDPDDGSTETGSSGCFDGNDTTESYDEDEATVSCGCGGYDNGEITNTGCDGGEDFDMCTCSDDDDDYSYIDSDDCTAGTIPASDCDCDYDADDTTTDITTTETSINCTDALERTRKTLISLSWRLLRIAAIDNPQTSFIGSPLAEFFLFYQLYLYTKNNTVQYTDLAKLLSIQAEEVCCVTGKVNNDVANLSPDDFANGVALFVDESYPLTNDFKNTMKNVIIGEALNLDFSRPDRATDNINKVHARQTRNKVPQTLAKSSNQISRKTEIVASSAMFLATRYPFSFTKKPGVFNVAPSKSIKTTFLYGQGSCKYAESLNAQFLEVALQDGLTIVMGLPSEPYSEKELLKSLLKSTDVLDKIRSIMKPITVGLSVPDVGLTTSIDVLKYLNETNIASSIRNRKTVSYINAFYGNKSPILNSSFQKNIITYDLTNKPTNSSQSYRASRPRKNFNANKPFIFMIFLREIPLMASVYANVEPSSVDVMI